jgi:hypothetical protein
MLTTTPKCTALSKTQKLHNLYYNLGRERYKVKPYGIYRAPSWLFASLDAKILFLKANPSIWAQLKDIRVKLAGPDLFGQVKSGLITLTVYNLPSLWALA